MPQRREPGIRRRLRVHWVRQVLWERDHPEARPGQTAPTYSPLWTSRNALTKWNPSCGCRMCKMARSRYSRKVKHPER